jgi:hypothetical protein
MKESLYCGVLPKTVKPVLSGTLMVAQDRWPPNTGDINMKCTTNGNKNKGHTIQVIA